MEDLLAVVPALGDLVVELACARDRQRAVLDGYVEIVGGDPRCLDPNHEGALMIVRVDAGGPGTPAGGAVGQGPVEFASHAKGIPTDQLHHQTSVIVVLYFLCSRNISRSRSYLSSVCL